MINYCPLAFLEDSGRNRTPDKLPVQERETLFSYCDRALVSTVQLLQPKRVIGIGRFAEQRAMVALSNRPVSISGVPHPSPANPVANRGWAALMNAGLMNLGEFQKMTTPDSSSLPKDHLEAIL